MKGHIKLHACVYKSNYGMVAALFHATTNPTFPGTDHGDYSIQDFKLCAVESQTGLPTEGCGQPIDLYSWSIQENVHYIFLGTTSWALFI